MVLLQIHSGEESLPYVSLHSPNLDKRVKSNALFYPIVFKYIIISRLAEQTFSPAKQDWILPLLCDDEKLANMLYSRNGLSLKVPVYTLNTRDEVQQDLDLSSLYSQCVQSPSSY